MADPAAPAAAAPNGLCADCGLCCDGTLYDRAVVEPGEHHRLQEAGITLVRFGKSKAFNLACAMLDGNRCKIYAARPGVCRTFRCELLKKFDAGSIPLAEALGRIATAKQLIERVRPYLKPGEGLAAARRRWTRQLAALTAGPAKEDAALEPGFLLGMTLLGRFLDRHFRAEHRQMIVERGQEPPVANRTE